MKRLFTKIRRNVSIALVTLLLRIILRRREYIFDVFVRFTDGENKHNKDFHHFKCHLTKHQVICLCLQSYDSSSSSCTVQTLDIRSLVGLDLPERK